MTPVPLHDLDAALFGALTPLLAGPPTPTQPFAQVSRWAGEFVADRDAPTVENYPCAILAALGEDGTPMSQDLSGDSETVNESMWTVFVGVEDARSDSLAVTGDDVYPTTGQPGALRLIDAVTAAVNHLLVPGLWQGTAVRFVNWRPYWIKRGVAYVYAVRFAAKRDAPEAPFPDPGDSLDEITGGVTPTGTDDTPPDSASAPFDFDPSTDPD